MYLKGLSPRTEIDDPWYRMVRQSRNSRRMFDDFQKYCKKLNDQWNCMARQSRNSRRMSDDFQKYCKKLDDPWKCMVRQSRNSRRMSVSLAKVAVCYARLTCQKGHSGSLTKKTFKPKNSCFWKKLSISKKNSITKF